MKSQRLSNGFTLIEMAIVLVLIGLLIGAGTSLISPLTKRAQLIENRDITKTAYEAVIGYAAQHKQLPSTLDSLGVKTTDTYGNQLQYYTWTGTNLCTSTGDYITVEDASNGTTISKNNIAFIIINSNANHCNQTGTASPFNILPQGQQVNSGTCPAGNEYDDIVMYADIDMLRQKICNTFRITTDSLPIGMEEQAYPTTVLQATDGTLPYNWNITSGALPPGLTLSNLTSGSCGTITCTSSNPCGCISGTPTQFGSFNFTLQVQDSDTPKRTATKSLAITINPNQPVITTESLPTATEELSYNVQLTATGGKTPYTWTCSSSPALPGGISIADNTISGTPHKEGNYNISCTVQDSGSPARTSIQKTLALTVLPNKPRITTEFLPLGTAGQAYPSTTLSATGGSGGNVWTQSGLPQGLSFNSSNATITGTPTAEGTYSVSFTVTDSSGDYHTKTLSITVYPSGGSSSSSSTSTSSTSSTSTGSGGLPPTCTLSVPINPIRYNSTATLNWTITNGPAWAAFTPSTGTCTSFSNSTGGSCTTNSLTKNTNITESVSNANGTGYCFTKVCVINIQSQYRVWNNTGLRYDFKTPNGTCRRVNNNIEITQSNNRLTTGTTIYRYSTSNNTCNGAPIASLTFNQAVCADDNNNQLVNFTGTDR